MQPVIIEVAINGATQRGRNPHVPQTPDEIAQAALACIDRGASIIHNHIEDIHLTGERAGKRYSEGWKPVLARHPDAIVCPTLTLAPDPQEAVSHMRVCAQGGAAMAPLDPGSVNLCNTATDGLPGASRFVYVNDFERIEITIDALRDAGLAPSVAIYEPGFLRSVVAYHNAGKLPPGTLIKLYFCGKFDFIGDTPHRDQTVPTVGFGLPPTRKALDAYLEMLEGCDLPWTVAILGGDCGASDVARYALERGGHLRVGLEDFGGPEQPDNAELVEQAVRLCRDFGRPPASFSETRAILGMEPHRPG